MIDPDWAAPWFAPYAGVGEPVLARLRAGQPVHAALAHPRFEPDGARQPADEGYEAYVARTGRVPTRHNAHDLFNGLVWLRNPVFKRALNEAHQTAPPAPAGRRGPVRDALTLLDESGILLVAPAPLRAALRAQDWPAVFVRGRTAWQGAQMRIVGHALLEKLLQPRKAWCARVLFVDDLDAPALPADLSPGLLPPLPVLGIPGWWPANEEEGFYADDRVFRPKRLASAPATGGFAC